MTKSLSEKFNEFRQSFEYDFSNEPAFTKARDLLINRWLTRTAEKNGIYKPEEEREKEFRNQIVEEIKLFSSDFEVREGKEKDFQNIIRGKFVELMFKSINSNFDSSETIKTIVNELNSSVGPINSETLTEIKGIVNTYFAHRRKVMGIYKKFMFKEDLIRFYYGIKDSSHDSVSLGPLGLEIEMFKEPFEERSTKDTTAFATSSKDKIVDIFKNPKGLLNIIYFRRGGRKDKTTLQHERSHCLDYLIQASPINRDSKESKDKRLDKEYLNQIKILDEMIRKRKSISEISKTYKKILALAYSHYDLNYLTEIIAFAGEPPIQEAKQGSKQTTLPDSLTQIKRDDSPYSKEGDIRINPYRDSGKKKMEERMFTYYPSTDLRAIFEHPSYDYMNMPEAKEYFMEPLNKVTSTDPSIHLQLQKVRASYEMERKEMISSIQADIEVLIKYYPDQKDTFLAYLRFCKSPDKVKSFFNSFISSLKKERRKELMLSEMLNRNTAVSRVVTNRHPLERNETVISDGRGNVTIYVRN